MEQGGGDEAAYTMEVAKIDFFNPVCFQDTCNTYFKVRRLNQCKLLNNMWYPRLYLFSGLAIFTSRVMAGEQSPAREANRYLSSTRKSSV